MNNCARHIAIAFFTCLYPKSLAFHTHQSLSRSFQINHSMWDPTTQTYTDGKVPSHHTALDIEDLLRCNGGKLKIFGYGSLCWHPGHEGVLALANKHDSGKCKVTTCSGRAIGYQRCWSQRSADHRGTVDFNGIVCTLLSDEEVKSLHKGGDQMDRPSLTEGMIYTVDEELVDDCLAELDFREKGGYARDVIDVIEDDTGETVKALLYRGTPENPAFWQRAYLDLAYAAAIMSVAIGPSGRNDLYLLHLHEFLSNIASHSPEVAEMLKDHSHDDRTGDLANMVKMLQSTHRPYFLFGAGSNEHNQLLLNDIDEVNKLTEMLLVVPREDDSSGKDGAPEPKALYAGGGHSALLTHGGDLYLWGWNSSHQLGRNNLATSPYSQDTIISAVQALGITVESAALGHTHTIIIEKGTKRLYAFGENVRGQVIGNAKSESVCEPLTPFGLEDDRFVDVAAGLFHSAAITEQGELVTWGCGRFGQSLSTDLSIGRWSPSDGSKLVQVVCGRRHTVVLDEFGRVWSIGENKYGQLGRLPVEDNAKPQLLDGLLGQLNSGCFTLRSGWSHVLALVRRNDESKGITLYGWGRNDKCQLGVPSTHNPHIPTPQVISSGIIGGTIQDACCGAESSHILDEECVYSTGWNEHGNLGIGGVENSSGNDESEWRIVSGASVVAPPSDKKVMKKLFAAGGAQLIVTRT